MKISTAIIQNKNIYENNENVFSARYKSHDIYITTYHGHGKPKHEHLNRYDITVRLNGSYAVDTYEDFHNIKDAIRYALKGALLLN